MIALQSCGFTIECPKVCSSVVVRSSPQHVPFTAVFIVMKSFGVLVCGFNLPLLSVHDYLRFLFPRNTSHVSAQPGYRTLDLLLQELKINPLDFSALSSLVGRFSASTVVMHVERRHFRGDTFTIDARLSRS